MNENYLYLLSISELNSLQFISIMNCARIDDLYRLKNIQIIVSERKHIRYELSNKEVYLLDQVDINNYELYKLLFELFIDDSVNKITFDNILLHIKMDSIKIFEKYNINSDNIINKNIIETINETYDNDLYESSESTNSTINKEELKKVHENKIL